MQCWPQKWFLCQLILLSIDFHALETDVRKEMMLRSKVGNASGDSVLISNLNIGPALEFERSDATRRLRLVLSELLAIMGQVIISIVTFDSQLTDQIKSLSRKQPKYHLALFLDSKLFKRLK